jgi:hypothetical protein
MSSYVSFAFAPKKSLSGVVVLGLPAMSFICAAMLATPARADCADGQQITEQRTVRGNKDTGSDRSFSLDEGKALIFAVATQDNPDASLDMTVTIKSASSGTKPLCDTSKESHGRRYENVAGCSVDVLNDDIPRGESAVEAKVVIQNNKSDDAAYNLICVDDPLATPRPGIKHTAAPKKK